MLDTSDTIPLLPSTVLREIRRTDKKLYRALNQLCGRVAAQIVMESPQDILLWLYLTGVSHGEAVGKIEGPNGKIEGPNHES